MFGLKDLTPDEKAVVRLGTLLAARKAEAFDKFYAANLPFWAETPAQRPGAPSVFKLPLFLTILGLSGVVTDSFPQCMLGGEWLKWTDLMHCWLHITLPTGGCVHESLWWRQP